MDQDDDHAHLDAEGMEPDDNLDDEEPAAAAVVVEPPLTIANPSKLTRLALHAFIQSPNQKCSHFYRSKLDGVPPKLMAGIYKQVSKNTHNSYWYQALCTSVLSFLLFVDGAARRSARLCGGAAVRSRRVCAHLQIWQSTSDTHQYGVCTYIDFAAFIVLSN